jgi:hypothetical protein
MKKNTFEFSITPTTLTKMLDLKRRSGFDKKKWDDWFEYIINRSSSTPIIEKSDMEKTIETLHYDSFNEWIQNFALNLENIWSESSARDLTPDNFSLKYAKHSAIVIGRGPSAKKHNHLKLIANSKYKGSIICCDGALIDSLEAGITPDKFPNYYVVTIDPDEIIRKYYDNKIVDKYGPKINGVFSTVVKPSTVERARKAGIKIHWLHSLFDYNEGRKSFNSISGLMVRAKIHENGLPAIQTGGNVGTSSWFIGWQILKCSTVALVGIDHGWNEDDPWDLIISHGRSNSSIKLDKNSPTFQKLFPKIYNPEFDCNCILDPLFQFYRNALLEFISRSPKWVNTINASEGGSIFGPRIKCLTLKNFLQIYKK